MCAVGQVTSGGSVSARYDFIYSKLIKKQVSIVVMKQLADTSHNMSSRRLWVFFGALRGKAPFHIIASARKPQATLPCTPYRHIDKGFFMDSLFPLVAIFLTRNKKENKTKQNKKANKQNKKKKKITAEELISMKRRLHAKRDKYAHEKGYSITFLNKTSRFFDLTDRHIFHDKSFLRSRRFI